MVTIQEIKEILKKRHITYQQLSDKTGISLGALKSIFRGQTESFIKLLCRKTLRRFQK